MKALSIKQPWAWLICAGHKDVENRNWNTNFRGRIYVHAGKSFDIGEFVPAAMKYRKSPNFNGDFRSFMDLYDRKILSYGAIIGEVDITGCIRNSRSPWAVPGQYHFLLANGILYDKPIPCRGALGFFEPKITERK